MSVEVMKTCKRCNTRISIYFDDKMYAALRSGCQYSEMYSVNTQIRNSPYVTELHDACWEAERAAAT